MPETCLTCEFHGPPISSYRGDRPCIRCITSPGFPLHQPVTTPFVKEAKEDPLEDMEW